MGIMVIFSHLEGISNITLLLELMVPNSKGTFREMVITYLSFFKFCDLVDSCLIKQHLSSVNYWFIMTFTSPGGSV